MDEIKKIVINENINTLRIDKALALLNENYSREYFSFLIKHEGILINNKLIKQPSYKVKTNDVIEYKLSNNKLSNGDYTKLIELTPYNFNLDIIYEDNDLLIINKPKGLVVHPGSGHIDDTLVNALIYHNIHLSKINGLYRVGIIHRIDKDTSGLLLIAKNDHIHNLLGELIKKHEVKRRYIALVDGVISEEYGKIVGKIGRDKNNRMKMTIDNINGKEAVTHFKVLKRFKKHTLIECELETGRTHQIRVHMSSINHSVTGDKIYGGSTDLYDNGQLLHAYNLYFIHPLTKKEVNVKCDLPQYFIDVLNKLKS